MRGLLTGAALLAGDLPDAVAARPAPGGRIRFRCDRCGTGSEVLVDGGAPEVGEVIEVPCDGCQSVGPARYKTAMFG